MSYNTSGFFSTEPTGFDQNFYVAPYNFNDPKSMDYAYLTGEYYYYYHQAPPTNQPAMSHSVTYPNFVDYRYVAPSGGDTQFVVSYSTSQLTEPDEAEYDPTPYGGGYDLELTYGKPLSASDEICHPRSLPNQNPNTNSYLGSIDLPPKKEPPIAQEEAAPKQNPPQEIQPQLQPQPPSEDVVGGDDDVVGDDDDSGAIVVYGGDNNYPWGTGYDCDRNLGYQEEPPFGFNPVAMDFCESLFGYWPCLHRKQRRSYGPAAEAEEVANDYVLWDSRFAADFVFGDSRYGEFGRYVHHGYENHYQIRDEQGYHPIVDRGEQSWFS